MNAGSPQREAAARPNLSRKLIEKLRDAFPESRHVTADALDTATDREIWDYARDHGYTIVSKDSDFRQLAYTVHRLRSSGSGWATPRPPRSVEDARRTDVVLSCILDVASRALADRLVFGVRPDVFDGLHRRGIATRVHIRYGQDWFRYWMRRIAESGGA